MGIYSKDKRKLKLFVRCSATDSVNEQTNTITVNIRDNNDERPTISVTSNTVTLAEELVAGTAVTFPGLAASDTDAGDVLSYSLLGMPSRC